MTERITTTGDLLNKLGVRSQYCIDLQENLDLLQKQIEGAKRTIRAEDEINELKIAINLRQQAIIRGVPEELEFTELFMNHIFNRGKAEDFLSLEKNKKFKSFNIENLIKPEVEDTISKLPLQSLMDFLTSKDIDLFSQEQAKLIDVKAISAIDNPIKKDNDKQLSVKELFDTGNLWVIQDKGKYMHTSYTALDNLIVLLIGKGWDKEKIKKAKITFKHTILPNFRKQGQTVLDEGEEGILILEYGKRQVFYSKEYVEEIIGFINDYTQKRKTSYQIVDENITRWPFDNTKKKLKYLTPYE